MKGIGWLATWHQACCFQCGMRVKRGRHESTRKSTQSTSAKVVVQKTLRVGSRSHAKVSRHHAWRAVKIRKWWACEMSVKRSVRQKVTATYGGGGFRCFTAAIARRTRTGRGEYFSHWRRWLVDRLLRQRWLEVARHHFSGGSYVVFGQFASRDGSASAGGRPRRRPFSFDASVRYIVLAGRQSVSVVRRDGFLMVQTEINSNVNRH